MLTRSNIIAMDKSVRTYDADGHLHVALTPISKANVCPYFGREIPDYQRLGLDANRVYMLWRHPEELRKGAATFAGKPLLIKHKPTTAEDHVGDLVVGTVGTDVAFDGAYLKAPLVVWTADAIEKIETEEQRELSSGYRYRADMTPGRTPDGVAFDGIMRDIMGNHVALVIEGRAGPDVLVADETPPEFQKMRFAKFFAGLAAAFPSIKPEQVVALDAALAEDVLKEVKAVKHCVEDKFPDMSEDERKAALDSYSKAMNKAMDALTDEDKEEAYKRAAKDRAPSASAGSQPPHAADEAAITAKAREGYVPQTAMDAAVADARKGYMAQADADKLAQDAATAARAEIHALYAARTAVEDTVGTDLAPALDSAEKVYRFALDAMKVDHKSTAAAGLPALYEASAKAAAAPAAPPVAQDSAAFNLPEILGLSHIRKG